MNYFSVLKSIGNRSTNKCANKTFSSKSATYNADFPPLRKLMHTSIESEVPIMPFKQVINLDCIKRARIGHRVTPRTKSYQDIVKEMWQIHDNCDILAFNDVRRSYKSNKRMWISVSNDQALEFGLCKWVIHNHSMVSVRDLYNEHQQRRKFRRNTPDYDFQAMGDSNIEQVDEASMGEFFSSDLFRTILRLVIFYRCDNTNRALLLLQWVMENPTITQMPDVTQMLDLLNSINLPSVPSERAEERREHAYKMQGADDSDNLSKLHAGIQLLTSMASSNNLRDVLMVVFAVVGITYSAISHKTVPLDIVKNSAATIGQMLGEGNPVILILKGIGQFITCLRIFFLEGYSGVMNWLVPFRDLGQNYAKAIELTNGVKNWNTLDDVQHDKLNTIGVHLDGWLVANTKSFNNASRDNNFKYATGQWTTIIRAVTEWKTCVRTYHNATSLRQQPFCVALVGGSGIGKTALQLRVLSIIMRAAGLNLKSDEYQRRIFSWDASKEYADGMTLLHKGVNVNEIAAQHFNAMTAAGIKSPVFDLLQILDINPYMTNQAQIENKANIPCHPYGVTLSGNDPDFGIHEIFKFPDVILRRIQHFCVVRVAPEFAAEGDTLDAVKAAAWNADPANIGKFEPFWRVCVMRSRVENEYRTNGQTGFVIRSHSDMIFPTFKENVQMPSKDEDFGPIEEYYKFLAKQAQEHHARQRIMVDKVLNRPIDFDVLFQSGDDFSEIGPESQASSIESTLEHLSKQPVDVAPGATPFEVLMIMFSTWMTGWCFLSSLLGFGGVVMVFINWGRILASVHFVGNSIAGLIAITGPIVSLLATFGAFWNGMRMNYVIRRVQGFVRGVSQATTAMAAGVRNVTNPFISGIIQACNIPSVSDEVRANYERVKRFCYVNLRAIVIACTLFTLYGYFSQTRILQKNADFSVKEVSRANVMSLYGEFPLPIALNAQELLVRTQDIENIQKPELKVLRLQMNESDWNDRQMAKLKNKPEFAELLALWSETRKNWSYVALPQSDNDNIPRYCEVPQPRLNLMQGAKTTLYSDFQRKVQDNVVVISMRTFVNGNTVVSDTHGLFVTDNIFVMNYHALLQRKLNGWKDLTLVVKPKFASKYGEFTMSFSTVEKAFAECYHESDLAFFRIPNGVDRRSSIESYLLSKVTNSTAFVKIAGHEIGGTIITRHMDDRLDGARVRLVMRTAPGDCGQPYIDTQGCVVYGIHAAMADRDHDEKIFQSLMIGHVVAAKQHFGYQQQGPIEIFPATTLSAKPHFKSVVTWLEKPEEEIGTVDVTVLGGFDGFRNNPKTAMRESDLFPILLRHYRDNPFLDAPFDCGKVPPVFNSKTCRQAHWKALVPLVTQPRYDADIAKDFRDMAEMYLTRVIANNKWHSEIEVLDWDDVINGVPGKRGYDALNWNTSAGFPYNHVKKLLFTEPDSSGKRYMNCDLAARTRQLERALQCGKVYPVFSTNLKDEVISEKKLQESKYRVFMASPIELTLVVRKYLLCIARVMQLYPYTFGAAVGMNSNSVQWSDLARYLGFKSQTIPFWHKLYQAFDGDYVDFDKNMRAEVTSAVKHVILTMVGTSYDAKVVATVSNILDVIFNPVVNYFGTFLQFRSLNPSGNSLTTQINCIANNLFVRYCFVKKYPKTHPREFDRMVKVMTYGDDLLVSVRQSRLSCRDMQDILAKINIKFTDANKNVEAQPFTEWNQLTFLKRNFSWHDHNGLEVCHAQIDKKSIIKMLQWYSVDTSCTRAQQIQSSIRSAAIESYLHGFDFYEHMSELVYTSLEEYMPGSGDVMGFPPYSELETWFMEAQDHKYRYDDPWWDDDFMQGYINCYLTTIAPDVKSASDNTTAMSAPLSGGQDSVGCVHQ